MICGWQMFNSTVLLQMMMICLRDLMVLTWALYLMATLNWGT